MGSRARLFAIATMLVGWVGCSSSSAPSGSGGSALGGGEGADAGGDCSRCTNTGPTPCLAQFVPYGQEKSFQGNSCPCSCITVSPPSVCLSATMVPGTQSCVISPLEFDDAATVDPTTDAEPPPDEAGETTVDADLDAGSASDVDPLDAAPPVDVGTPTEAAAPVDAGVDCSSCVTTGSAPCLEQFVPYGEEKSFQGNSCPCGCITVSPPSVCLSATMVAGTQSCVVGPAYDGEVLN
jgi:hypothetical protein